MNFIEELYYGNNNPNEKRYDKDTLYAKIMRKFCDSENELGNMLNGKPLHLVNDLINASDEIVAISKGKTPTKQTILRNGQRTV